MAGLCPAISRWCPRLPIAKHNPPSRASVYRVFPKLRDNMAQNAGAERAECLRAPMLKTLRSLFVSAAPPPAEPLPADGKVTLADVLRRGWFEQWYQPKIELRTRRLVGAEALVRARQPD